MRTPTIFDVAKYILEKRGPVSHMKLQRLAYFVKVWGIVWDEEEIFPEGFQAWANGAVSPELYDRHKRMFKVSSDLFSDADSGRICENHKETIDKVLEFYGDYTAQQLSDINHQELPWKEARGDLPPMARCTNTIELAAISEYYSGLPG